MTNENLKEKWTICTFENDSITILIQNINKEIKARTLHTFALRQHIIGNLKCNTEEEYKKIFIEEIEKNYINKENNNDKKETK